MSRVEVTDDLGSAKVYIRRELGGEPEAIKAALKGLSSASGKLRAAAAKALDLRTTPSLHFYYDEAPDAVVRIEEVLRGNQPRRALTLVRPRCAWSNAHNESSKRVRCLWSGPPRCGRRSCRRCTDPERRCKRSPRLGTAARPRPGGVRRSDNRHGKAAGTGRGRQWAPRPRGVPPWEATAANGSPRPT